MRYPYRKCACSLITINGLINHKVGICDFIAQEVRALVVVVVLAQSIVVLGDKFIFVCIILFDKIRSATVLPVN